MSFSQFARRDRDNLFVVVSVRGWTDGHVWQQLILGNQIAVYGRMANRIGSKKKTFLCLNNKHLVRNEIFVCLLIFLIYLQENIVFFLLRSHHMFQNLSLFSVIWLLSCSCCCLFSCAWDKSTVGKQKY